MDLHSNWFTFWYEKLNKMLINSRDWDAVTLLISNSKIIIVLRSLLANLFTAYDLLPYVFLCVSVLQKRKRKLHRKHKWASNNVICAMDNNHPFQTQWINKVGLLRYISVDISSYCVDETNIRIWSHMNNVSMNINRQCTNPPKFTVSCADKQ